MSLYDQTLRTPPYLKIFPGPTVRDEALDAIAGEIRESGGGDEDPGAFALLQHTGRVLADLRDPEQGTDGGPTQALLLFHAYHLRARGAEHLLASVPVCRWAVEASEGSDEKPESGGPASGLPAAAYVQLPQHLFWVRDAAGDRPLSLDGFFWTVLGDAVHVLGVMDVLAPEGGLRVLPLPGVPLADRPLWLSERMREEGEDFRSEIPGAEMEGLYELRTAGELLKLAARLDRFMALFPDAREPVALGSGEAAESREAAEGGEPAGRTGVAAHRLVLR